MNCKNFSKPYAVLKSILDVQPHSAEDGFATSASEGYVCLSSFFESLNDAEAIDKAKHILTVSQEIQADVMEILLERIHKQGEELNKKLLTPIPQIEKQQTFSSDEVRSITGVKSKDTIGKYFKEGKIQAKKDARGQWVVLRSALAEYLGHDNF